MVFDGEVDHQDTAGNGGRISSGGVQWMTAGSGLLHKEMHSPEFSRAVRAVVPDPLRGTVAIGIQPRSRIRS